MKIKTEIIIDGTEDTLRSIEKGALDEMIEKDFLNSDEKIIRFSANTVKIIK